MLLIKSKRHRNEQIVVEGKLLIKEAINNQFKLTHIFFSNIENIEYLLDDLKKFSSAEIIKVPQHDLKQWSVLTTCPGVIAIFDKKEVDEDSNSLPISVICDNIREPNNLGSIIRVAKAVACRQVILTKGKFNQLISSSFY
jgi:tRNA G18 (ribose-2'-O)-methylase SpoU